MITSLLYETRSFDVDDRPPDHHWDWDTPRSGSSDCGMAQDMLRGVRLHTDQHRNYPPSDGGGGGGRVIQKSHETLPGEVSLVANDFVQHMEHVGRSCRKGTIVPLVALGMTRNATSRQPR
jgi:hypothetical protein